MKNTIIAIATTPFLILSAYAGDIVDFGAKTKAPTEITATQLELNEDSGFVITEVREGSAAATLGLKKNDIVTAVNGKSIGNIISLSEYIAATCADGAEVSLTWNSGGDVKTARVSVTEKVAREDFIASHHDATRQPITDMNKAIQKMSVDVQHFDLDYSSSSTIIMNVNSTVTSTVGDHVFTGSKVDGHETIKHLKIAKKKGGEVKFEGDVSSSDLSNVPEDLREDTEKFLSLMKITNGIVVGTTHNLALDPQGHTKNGNTLEKNIDALVEDIDNDN